MPNLIESIEGDVFVQETPRENWAHLDCANLGPLPLPLGDLTPVYCRDRSEKGRVVVAGKIRGDPSLGTTTIDQPLATTVNWLFERRCDFPMLVTLACQGAPGIPENYQVAAVVPAMSPTQVTLNAAAVRERGENARILIPAELSYDDVLLLYHIGVNIVTVANTAAANGVVFLPEACGTKCGSPRDMCEEGYMALDGTLYDSEVKYTSTGTNWAQTAADPFEEGGDASSPVTLTMWDRHRAVVSRISASVWRPAEISYTEDLGVSWTNVDVGAVVGAFFGRHGLVYSSGRLYAAVSGGRIYDSRDIGDTWVIREEGTTTEDLNALAMESLEVGYAVGNSNAFLYTTNGNDWYARVGPAVGVNLLSVGINAAGDVFVGAADGNIYRSEDGGQNWLQNDGLTPGTWRSFGVGSVDWIGFDDKSSFFGFAIYNTAAPVGTIYRSTNQGATWSEIDGQTGAWNAGLNAMHICDQNHGFVVGEPFEGNTMVVQIEPQ